MAKLDRFEITVVSGPVAGIALMMVVLATVPVTRSAGSFSHAFS
jgi:hypothetical protein